MATREQLIGALRQAHEAGDTAGAQRFAEMIKSGQFDPPPGRMATAVNQAREQAQPAPTERGSVADSLGQGALFGWSDEIASAINATIGGFDPQFEGTTWGERYDDLKEIARGNLEAYRERSPRAAMAAEVAGGVLTGGAGLGRAAAGAVGARALPGAAKAGESALRTIGRGTLGGAAQGAAYGAGASESEDLAGIAEDAKSDAIFGGAAGGVVSSVLRGGRSLLRNFADVDDGIRYQAARSRLEREGVPMTTGDALGSQRLKAFEDSLGSTAFGPSLSGHATRQQEAFQRSLMNKAGFPKGAADTGLITDETLAAAKKQFDARYSAALDGVDVDLDTPTFLGALEKVGKKYGAKKGGEAVTQEVDELIDAAASGKITGRMYQELRSELSFMGRVSPTASPIDRRLARGYSELKAALDDAYSAGLPPQVGAAKKSIDREYNRFKVLDDAYKNLGGSAVEGGYLPYATLNRATKKRAGGDQQFRRLVSAGSQVLPSRAPDTGSSGRNLAIGLTAAPAAAGLAAGTGEGGDAQGGVASAAAMLAAPLLLQRQLARGRGAGLAGQIQPGTINAANDLATALTRGGLGGYYSATGGNPDDVAP